MSANRFPAKSRAMAQLRKEGWPLVLDVETRRGPFVFDALGCLDVIAYHPIRGWLGVQVTMSDLLQRHIERIAGNRVIRDQWCAFGFGFQVWLYPSAQRRSEGDDEMERVDMRGFVMGGESPELDLAREVGTVSD